MALNPNEELSMNRPEDYRRICEPTDPEPDDLSAQGGWVAVVLVVVIPLVLVALATFPE